MTSVIIHRPVRAQDAHSLASRLRPADKLEIVLSLGRTDILAALLEFIDVSSLECQAVVIDGTVEAIYGLAHGGGEYNIPWMLGSEEVMRHKRQLLTWGRATLRYWADRYDLPLRNHVLGINRAHVNWLRHIGCTLHGVQMCGPLNSSFIPFEYV